MGYGPSWRGILFRQTYPQLTDLIAKSKRWFPQIHPNARFTENNHEWTFPDGEKLLLRHFLKPDDYWNYHGHESPFIGWEELCNWANDEGYKRMISCCRSSIPEMPRMLRSTANPYGPGHNWVKRRFRLPGAREQLITDSLSEKGDVEPPRMAIHGTIHENKILLKSDPEYLNRLASSARNQAELDAWLYGSWDIVAGGMFDDVFSKKYNIVEKFKIPSNWRIDRSLDWGSAKPFSVGWWARSNGEDVKLADGTLRSTVKGDLFRIAEWYGCRPGRSNDGLRLLATEVAKGIIEREKAMGIYGWCRPGPADSSIYDSEGTDKGQSIGDDMAKEIRMDDGSKEPGILWTRADKSKGSRKAGWELMRIRFKDAHATKGGPREKPGLFIFDNCVDFINTVPVLPRDEKDMDDVDTDAEDHIGDETRYRVREENRSLVTGTFITTY